MRTLPWLVSLGWRFRIEAMTNICDWIKEFCSYIKLWVSGASNKYSIWLQFEWLQCCSAQSPGIRSYLRCRELQWRRGRSVRGLLTPGLIIRCHSPGSDQWPWVMMSVACLSCLESADQCWRTMAWPQLFRSVLWEAEAPPPGRRPLSHWLVRPLLTLAWLKPQVRVSTIMTRGHMRAAVVQHLGKC